jgi:hypothetical protein
MKMVWTQRCQRLNGFGICRGKGRSEWTGVEGKKGEVKREEARDMVMMMMMMVVVVVVGGG